MKLINYTIPGRFHLIIRTNLFYITVWFRDKRFHKCWMNYKVYNNA